MLLDRIGFWGWAPAPGSLGKAKENEVGGWDQCARALITRKLIG